MKVLPDDYRYESKRMVIRFYNENDFQSWQKFFSNMRRKQNRWDWENENISSLTKKRFRKKLIRHKEERLKQKVYYFCVEDKVGKLIGICIINNIDKNHETGEIGFQLSNKYWGKGLGKELASAICTIGLKEIELTEVTAKVNKENLVSIHILQDIGMKYNQKNKSQLIFSKER